jgi:hypothetical protein
MAERDGRSHAADALEQRLARSLVHDEARAGMAGLARVVVDAPGNVVRRRLQVRIRKHHLRGLAAEFERHALEVGLRGVAQHQAPDLGGTGEGDEVDVRVQGEGLAGFLAEPGYHVEDPRRHAGLERQLAQADAGER